ncbi:hypothetical protein BCR36DRAFT_586274 [Piromyces finnis]|uniref:Phosphodiesterase n=1 Tax=Piromyces finnis TaxID=1754191 RepID=A0A1Y1UZI7_9FUNG|nr:hypothetical protein BCR36DRAFT_586274 [Piromyces finnis]|eukprot:ORX44142.1 hypothetical protein BCR36DRAFT_586274 [Piromyces finnis]
MTYSQRKNSSGSKRLLPYIQKIGTSNETLVLKDNMETDSHSSVETSKSEEDNLLSMAAMGAILPIEDTTHNVSSNFHTTQPSSINKQDDNTLRKYNRGHKKSISIDIQNIKRKLSDQSMNNNNVRSRTSPTPKIIHSAPSNSVSQFNLIGNPGLSNGYKHRSYTNGYTFNTYQHHSPHSQIYNIPSYSVTSNNTNPPTTSHNNASNNNGNSNVISSSVSTISYNNSNNNNSVFSNTTLNNQSSSITSANSLSNRHTQNPIEYNTINKNHEEDNENTPLNIITSVIDDSGYELNDQVNSIDYKNTEDNDDIYNSTDMYSSTKPKSTRKQKSFYKRLMNQSGENGQIQEDYLDIKREDTRIIHDIFQKSIHNNFSLCFKDPYTEISYYRYIHNKFLYFWKKSVVLLALTTLINQLFLIFSVGLEKNQNKKVYEIILLNIIGLIIPVSIFYYIIYRLKTRVLFKLMPYLANLILFVMGPLMIIIGPLLILGSNIIIENNNYYEITLFMYISLFFVGNYLLFYSYKPAIFSVLIYCVCWIVFVFNKVYCEFKNENNDDRSRDIYLIILTIALFCLISVVMLYSLYKKERTSRRQFLNEQRLMRINSKLVSQLNRIERGFADEAADLDAPIEKAIITIRSLMASPTIGPEHLKALGLVLCYLQVPNLFAPDLDQQVTQGLKMDDERKNWLFSEVAHRKQIERSKRSSSSSSSLGTGSHSPFYTGSHSPSIHDHQSEYQVINIDNYLTNHSAELLSRINEYNFPMFEYFKSTSRPLLTMSYHIFVKSGLLSRLHLSVNQFLNFMSAVEDGYHPEHQFHNAEHASDVLHCIYYFSTIPNVATCFKDLDYLGLYVAACIHDFDHPGVNNKFLINVGDPLAERYNDKSVLENHHCSSALRLLNKPGNNFIERLDKEKKRELRETIIELVLATDLSGHFAYLTSFKKKLLDTLTCNTREDRLLLMQMFIKCCDVSNPTKSRSLYKEWINRVMSEFYSQGDREKQLNITISPFCNRNNSNVYSCQKGFIDFVAAPIFEAVGEFIGKYQITKNAATQKQLQISSANTSLSRESSVQANSTNDTSLVNRDSVTTDLEKQKIISSSSTCDENNTSGNTSTLRQSKSYNNKTYSKMNLLESQEKINVVLDGLKSNKEWIDSNAAKTESSS